jgi:glycerol-3-phosphate acyltransferase PlsY
MEIAVVGFAAYMLGSLPFGKLAGLARGIDIQKHGSGNIGFANSVRVLGWRWGLVVLLGDVLKGTASVLLALRFLHGPPVLAVASAALVGHVFPVWLRFRGGKAIATGLGVVSILCLPAACIGVATYLAVFSYTRTSGIASIIGTWTLPVSALFFAPKLAAYFLALAGFAVYTHRSNIRDLVTEKLRADR